MHRVIDVHIAGQPAAFRMHDDAYEAVHDYLAQARSRLVDAADAGQKVEDLERSIGERLAARAGSPERILEAADVAAVLAEFGPVAPHGPGASSGISSPGRSRVGRRRRLYRIKEGEAIAGVCVGLSAYAELRLDWVRTIFVLLALVTAGLFSLVYLVMMFVLPVVPTRADWIAAMEAADSPRTA